MPFLKLQFRPGLNKDQTNYSSEGGWWECDKVRFVSNSPQKIGGWEKYTPTAFWGACRQMMNYATTYSDDLLVLGTNNKLYIEAGGIFYDITPLRTTSPTMTTTNTDNSISVVTGTKVVTFSLGTVHGMSTGSFVVISGVTGNPGSIPNAEINSNFQVTVTSTTAFTITVPTTNATSTAGSLGGTAITLSFEVAAGNPITVAGYGWGTSTWSRGTWGLGSAAPYYLPQQDWFIDYFDNDIVANIRDGAGYIWERGTSVIPTTALNTKAILLSAYATASGYTAASVPVKIGQLMVSQNDTHLLAFGAVPFGSVNVADFDPMLVRWADQDNPGQWTPEVTNSAGDLRIPRGSYIVCAIYSRQEILVFTDTTLHSLQFLGTTDVFGVQEYAGNISIASPRAVASASNTTFWMGRDKFYMYNGRLETLDCSIEDYIFNDLTGTQKDQIVCGVNEQWEEIWWFYPSRQANWNDRYAVYDYEAKLWYYGTMDRTAWLDSAIRSYPYATTGMPDGSKAGFLYVHEYGLDDDGAAMEAYIQSSDFDLGDGDQLMLSRRMIPDVSFDGSTAATPSVTMQLRSRNFPGSALASDSSDTQTVTETTVDVFTEQVFVRARARQMAIKIASTDLGVQWQLGYPRLDVRPDGKR